MSNLLKDSLKKLNNVAVLLSSFLLLSFLLAVISEKNGLKIGYGLLMPIVMICVLAVPMINFSFLYNRASGTYMLSLPFTKSQIFLVKYISGLIVMLVPSFIYLFLLNVFIGTMSYFFTALIPFTILILLYYTIVCLVASLVGVRIIQLFLSVLLFFMPLLLYVFLMTLIFAPETGQGVAVLESRVHILFPFYKLFSSLLTMKVPVNYCLLYSGYTVFYIILAIFVASKRPFENIGDFIVFRYIKYIIRLVVIISFSWIIIAVMYQSKNSILLVCLLSTFVVAILTSINRYKKINFKLIIIETIIISLVSSSILYLSINYMKYKIPSNIQSASFYFEYGKDNGENEAIKDDVINMQKYLMSIDEVDASSGDTLATTYVTLTYKLNNGDYFRRGYSIGETEYHQIMEIISSSENSEILIKMIYEDYFKFVKDDKITSINIQGNLTDGGFVEISKEDLLLFKNILSEQLTQYIQNPKLLLQTSGEDSNWIEYEKVSKGKIDYQSTFVYKNDPFYLAYQKFQELNAK